MGREREREDNNQAREKEAFIAKKGSERERAFTFAHCHSFFCLWRPLKAEIRARSDQDRGRGKKRTPTQRDLKGHSHVGADSECRNAEQQHLKCGSLALQMKKIRNQCKEI